VDVIPASLIGDPQAREQMRKPAFGGEGDPVADPEQVGQAPASASDPEGSGVASDDVQEGFFSLRFRLAVRGKKRACARVPVEWSERPSRVFGSL
jgi:hypothetical protein